MLQNANRWQRGWLQNQSRQLDCIFFLFGLLRGLEAAINFQQEILELDRRRSTIILFADNMSSVKAIMEEKPGPSQHISQQFMEAAMAFLNKNWRANIEISWVPGHMGIEGNNRADKLAKEVTELKLATETTTLTCRLTCILHTQSTHTRDSYTSENWTQTLQRILPNP